ncbi:glycosyltransferase [Sphingobacterium multivorum]|uniref:glycosyltransferase n=1 Tax=Sphingobacterium multivorum TaxID=28454 RepID=UPI0030164EF3
MKILLIQHLYFLNGIGGTEKICSILANILSANGYEVEIATNENIIGTPVFALDKNVRVTNIYDAGLEQIEEIPIYNYRGRNPFLWIKYKLKKKYAKWYNRRLIRRMEGEDKLFQYNLRNRAIAWKSYIDQVKPNLIITMSIGSLLEITYGNNLSIPILDSVNGRPDYDYSNVLGGRKPYMVELLTTSFSKLDGIQILFDSYRKFLPDSFAGKCRVITNPIEEINDAYLVRHSNEKSRYKIIHIGRLDTACKQQHIAIEIFSNLAEKYPTWDLEFWGIGNDFERLNLKILELGLSKRIFLRGFTDDPIAKMKDADIFIFPSRYEGFGLALAEAMSVGLPTIGFGTCSGVNELITHGENGFLANDQEDMELYLEQLINNPLLREQMGIKGKIFVKDFNLDKMAKGWLELIDAVIDKYDND